MIKKHIVVLTTLVIWTNIAAAVSINEGEPKIGEQLFYNRFYLRYSHGISIYLNDVKGGYPGFTGEEIRIGMTLEPEIGVIIKDAVQLGISYLYMDGISESAGETNGLVYDDVFFSGAALKVRYFLLNRRNIKIPVGIEVAAGACMLYSGYVDSPGKKRGLSYHSSLIRFTSYFEGNGYGGGISGSLVYQPFRWMTFGVDALFRVVRSEIWKVHLAIDREYEMDELYFSSLSLNVYLSLLY